MMVLLFLDKKQACSRKNKFYDKYEKGARYAWNMYNTDQFKESTLRLSAQWFFDMFAVQTRIKTKAEANINPNSQEKWLASH